MKQELGLCISFKRVLPSLLLGVAVFYAVVGACLAVPPNVVNMWRMEASSYVPSGGGGTNEWTDPNESYLLFVYDGTTNAAGDLVDVQGDFDMPIGSGTPTVTGGVWTLDGTAYYDHGSLTNISPPWSIAFWCTVEGYASGYDVALGNFDNGDYFGFRSLSGNLLFVARINGTAIQPDSGDDDTDTSWRHVVWTYDGTNMWSYQNGTNIFNQTYSGMDVDFRVIGAGYSSTYKFNGSQDNIRWYKKCLSATDVWNLYNNGPQPGE